jgi:hypothetical protein
MLLNKSTTSTMNTQIHGWTPPTRPTSLEDYLEVVFLFSKASDNPDIRQKDSRDNVREQVLAKIVGIVTNELGKDGYPTPDGPLVTHPDPTGNNKWPPVGSEAFKNFMNMETGIVIKSMDDRGLEVLRTLTKDNHLPGINSKSLEDAIKNNTLKNLLRNRGAFLDSVGVYDKLPLTMTRLVSSTMQFSISFVGEGEGDTFSESFNYLQQELNSQNVAIYATISKEVDATQLGSSINYTPREFYFHYKPTTVRNSTKYRLDLAYAKSGKPYRVSVVTGANISDLTPQSTNANHKRITENVRNGSLSRMATKGQVTSAPSDFGL